MARAPSRTVDAQLGQPAATFPDSFSLNAGTTRSPASSRITRASLGVDARNSRFIVERGDDRELARDLHPGRPAADDDEGQPLVPRGRVVAALGLLERAEEALRRSTASASVFSPHETSAHSSWPK